MTHEKVMAAIRNIMAGYPFVPYTGCRHFPQEKIKDLFLKEIEDSLQAKKTGVLFSEAQDAVLLFHHLPWDTSHFQTEMGKISHCLYREDQDKKVLLKLIQKACDEAVNSGWQHLSCSVHPKEMVFVEALQDAGFYLKAVLVDYVLDLNRFSAPACSTCIQPAGQNEADRLADLAEDAFSRNEDWYDRFHADSFFKKEKSDSLYREWFLNSLSGDQADQVLAAMQGKDPVGFITCKLEKEKSVFLGKSYGNVPLNAVDIRHRRKGIYRDLVTAGLAWFQSQGVDIASVRTQASTIAVQKTWQRLGAEVAFYHLVFHKNFE